MSRRPNPMMENGEFRCTVTAELSFSIESKSDLGVWESRNVKFSLSESLPSSDWVPDAMDRLKTIVVQGVVRTPEEKVALVESERFAAEEVA